MAMRTLPLALMAWLASVVSATQVPLTWDSGKGATFAFNSLFAPNGWKIHDARHNHTGGGAYTWHYIFNVGGDVVPTPPQCATTVGSDGVPSSAPAPAFQVWDKSSRCQRLAGPTTSSSNVKFSLLDPLNPAVGVKILYTGGDDCGVPPRAYRRSFSINLYCENDAFNIPDLEDVEELTTCRYELNLYNAAGCPTQCPKEQGVAVCGDAGKCDYDASLGVSRCFCDSGYYGPGCTASCQQPLGAALNTPDCNGNGVCGWDPEMQDAHCFCYTGYLGADCQQSANSVGGSVAATVVGLILSAIVLVIVYWSCGNRIKETYRSKFGGGPTRYTSSSLSQGGGLEAGGSSNQDGLLANASGLH